MKIGLFFGTFDPIHKGHLHLAEYYVNSTDLDSVIFVITAVACIGNFDAINFNASSSLPTRITIAP